MSKDYSFPDDWSASPSRVRLFLDRHKRSVSVVGALIVFSTFVVRDEIREHVKDTVSSLRSAEDVFVVRSHNELTLNLLNGIQSDVDNIWNSTPDRVKYLNNERGFLDSRLLQDKKLVLQAKSSLDNLKRLVEKLPEEELSLRNSLSNLEQRFGWINLSNAGLSDDLLDVDKSVTDDDPRVLSLGIDSPNLLEDIATVSARTVERSDQIRKAQEHRLLLYTWLSYFLYVIGWSLALSSRLFGLDSRVEES